jgi:hypothetical protein
MGFWDAMLGKECMFATCFYNVGNFAVNVMYAMPGERRNGLRAAWHPRLGAKRLLLTDFDER